MIKSAFFTNQRVLEVYSLGWLIERFFLETVGVEYASLSAAAEHVALPLLNIERKLSRVRANIPFFPRITHNSPFQMLLSHIQSGWFNPPRRRRFLARSLLEWQELYDATSALSEKGNPIVSVSCLMGLSPIEKQCDRTRKITY